MNQGLAGVLPGKFGRVCEGWPAVCPAVVDGVLRVMFHSWLIYRHENHPPSGSPSWSETANTEAISIMFSFFILKSVTMSGFTFI